MVWDSTQIDLSQPFDITLSVNMQPWGADGIALVLQNAGLNAWGAGGNALGYGNAIPASGYAPIVNSVAFELDAWDNSGAGVNDIPTDHVAIHINGDMTTTQGAPASANASGFDITDALCHQLRVTWNPATNQIRIFFDADPVPRITRIYNMVTNVFGGNPLVWWGVTGSSGGAGMTQTVCVGRNFTRAGTDRHLCAGDTVQLRARGGTTYAWSPLGPLLSNSSIPNPVFGPAAVGNYAYEVSAINSALCTDIDSITLHVEAVPVANAGPGGSICLGDSLQVGTAGIPGYSYLWQPATLLSTPNIAQPWLQPTAAGILNYNLIVTNAAGLAGCADTAALVVTARDTPTVAVTATPTALCQGQSSTLTATPAGGGGGYGYAWGNGPLVASQSVAPAATTTYTVTVTDAFTCRTSGNVTLTVAPTPTASPGLVANVCLGDSAQLGTAPQPGYTYLWQPSTLLSNASVAQPWLQPTTAGPLSYDLIVSTTTGFTTCSDTATLAIVARDTPTVSIAAINDTICLGQSSTLTAVVTSGTGPFSYNWLNGPVVASQVVSPLSSTPYSIHITDAYNCMTDGRIALVVNDTPTVSLTATPDSICAGQASTLIGSASGGTPGYGFLWSNGAITAGTSISPLATTTVALTVTDLAGCTSLATGIVTVNVADSLAILSADTFLCLGGQLQVTNTFSTAGINSWQWSPSAGVSNPGIPNPLLSPTAGTTYYLQGTNTSTGCGYRDSVVIGYAPLGPPSLNLGADADLCAGQFLTLDATNPGFSYLWSDGSTADTLIDSTSGWVSVAVFDTLGCGYSVTDSLLLTMHALPTPQLPADTTICPSDSLILSAGIAPASYLWSTGDTGASIWTQGAATYWLRVIDSFACVGSDTFRLAVSTNLVVSLSGLAPDYCISDSAVQLSYAPPGGIFAGPVNGAGIFVPAVAGVGSHTLRYSLTDSTGCTYFSTAQTVVHAAPTAAQAGPDQVVTDAAQLSANAPLIGQGSWTLLSGTGQFSATTDPQATLSGLAPGSYTLVWTIVQPPCPASKDSLLLVIEGLSLPTGFSPNGDGVNDYFVIHGISTIPDAHLSIFNRWGNLVWQQGPYRDQWDGRNLDGQVLVDDTYYAILTYGSKALNTYVVLKRD